MNKKEIELVDVLLSAEVIRLEEEENEMMFQLRETIQFATKKSNKAPPKRNTWQTINIRGNNKRNGSRNFCRTTTHRFRCINKGDR